MRYSDDSSGFVCLNDFMPDALYDIRYHSSYNFIGERIDGYAKPLALITYEAAKALNEVNNEFRNKGYVLKIYDAYRPQKAVDHFVRWAKDISDIRMKQIFYPEIDKEKLFELGYIASNSSHTRGSTVDLTLCDIHTHDELDMGGSFDDFSERSHPDYRGITEIQYADRILLRNGMIKHGFLPIDTEWWHFTLADEPYPDTYFTFDIDEYALKQKEM